MSQLLKTNHAVYLFDPANESLALKKKGKFSSVYVGYQLPDKIPVIIKKLNEDLVDDPLSTRRFHREAVIAQVHEQLQQVIDLYKDENNFYLIKQYLDGDTLKFIYQEYDNLPAAFYVKCMIGVLDILQAMHLQGYVHCDIRPDNILVQHLSRKNMPDFVHPFVYLLDPGLSKVATDSFHDSHAPFAFVYSPPEQMLDMGDLVNPSSDVYSCGVTLYQCITGKIPFFNSHPEKLMHLQLNTNLEPDSKIPKELMPILLKATNKSNLSKPPSQLSGNELKEKIQEGQTGRYQTADEFKSALEKVLYKLPQDIRKRSFWNW